MQELTGWLKSKATSSWMWTVYNYKIYVQAITGKNNEAKVVALGAMTFDDAIAMVSNNTVELQLAA